MKKFVFLIILSVIVIALVFINSFDFNGGNTENSKQEDTQDIEQTLKEAVKETEQMNIKDEHLKNWTIRALIDKKMNHEDYTEKEINEIASYYLKKNNEWFRLAKEYGVTVSEEEIDDYITELKKDNSNNTYIQKVAKGLGISKDELFFSFDRELYKKNLVWEKLQPILIEKYATTDNNQLLQMFDDEVLNRL